MPAQPPRAVFDCNIFVQMVLNPRGPAGQCKRLVEQGKAILFVSEHVLAEVKEVLNRPRFKSLIPDLTPEKVASFVAEITAISIPLTNVPEEFRLSRDPEDEAYINLALVADADYIVSLDRDLLDLMDTTTAEARTFQRRYPMLRVIKPGDLLRELERE